MGIAAVANLLQLNLRRVGNGRQESVGTLDGIGRARVLGISEMEIPPEYANSNEDFARSYELPWAHKRFLKCRQQRLQGTALLAGDAAALSSLTSAQCNCEWSL